MTEQRIIAGRQNQLQFLRFLAFLNIFISHCESWVFFPYRTSHCAHAAVSFFFMLSGLVTGYSLMRKDLTHLSWKAEGAYVGKKLSRIYPLYLVTTLIAVIFSGLPINAMAGDWGAFRQEGGQLLRNLLLIQSWFPEGAHSFNSVGWFLSALMFSYVCALPIGRILNRLTKSRHPVFALCAAFGGTAFCVILYCHTVQENMTYWQYQHPLARLGEFSLGMILGYLTTLVREKICGTGWRRWLLTGAEIFALGFWYACLSRPGNYWCNRIVAWMAPNALLLTVFSLGGGWVSELFRRKVPVYLGDISFECYLVHQMIIIRLAAQTADIPVSPAGKVFCFMLCLVISLVTAAFLHGRRKTA